MVDLAGILAPHVGKCDGGEAGSEVGRQQAP
jgi:hypothetical protein